MRRIDGFLLFIYIVEVAYNQDRDWKKSNATKSKTPSTGALRVCNELIWIGLTLGSRILHLPTLIDSHSSQAESEKSVGGRFGDRGRLSSIIDFIIIAIPSLPRNLTII